MATKSFVTYSPKSGTGDGNVIVSAGTHTGRKRLGPVKLYVSASGCNTKTVSVYQAGKSEFLLMNDGSDGECIVPNVVGEFLTLYGKSNTSSFKMTYSDDTTDPMNLDTAGIVLYVNDSQVCTADQTTAQAVSGDPGNDAQFDFEVRVYADRIAGTGQTHKAKLRIFANNNSYVDINLKQTGATPSLSVSPTSIEIPADGTAQSFTVTSNTSWSIS